MNYNRLQFLVYYRIEPFWQQCFIIDVIHQRFFIPIHLSLFSSKSQSYLMKQSTESLTPFLLLQRFNSPVPPHQPLLSSSPIKLANPPTEQRCKVASLNAGTSSPLPRSNMLIKGGAIVRKTTATTTLGGQVTLAAFNTIQERENMRLVCPLYTGYRSTRAR